MELIGSYHSQGYTIEIYFPENGHPDGSAIWVLRDGEVIREFVECLTVEFGYGMDHAAMARLEIAAEVALQETIRAEARN